MTRYYHLTSQLVRISEGSLDAVWGGGGGKMEGNVSEANLVHAHFIPFHPRPLVRPRNRFTHSSTPSGLVWFVSFSFLL